MNCEHAIELISALLDRELAPDDRDELEAHLEECASCRVTLEAFTAQDSELRESFLPRREAAVATAQQVSERLPVTGSVPATKAVPKSEFSWGLLAITALAVAGVALVWWWTAGRNVDRESPRTSPTETHFVHHLKPRPRPDVPTPVVLKVGELIETQAGERRRVALPDGSILFVNQNTTVRLDAKRKASVTKGDVYIEVSPRTGNDHFVIATPSREVTALGTKFSVNVEDQGTTVLVTQGKVKVSGVANVLEAGQQLLAEGKQQPAPRTSYVLDWTRDLMTSAEAALIPASKHQGGSLVVRDANGDEAKLTLRKFHVDVHVEDGFARTTIDQTYFNHHPWRLEGTFYFPLPADASLSRLAMYVDGNLMEGGMTERDYARNVYQRIVTSQKDPALLEWVDGTTFKMRVFPLEGRREKRIVLSYTQRLPSLYGRTQYRFPAGHNLQVVDRWSFHARVKDGADLHGASPSHPAMNIEREGSDLVLNAKAEQVKVGRDVVFELQSPSSQPQGETVRFSRANHEGSSYLMMRYRPDLPTREKKERRDWVFLFESSADRDPLVARTQIEILRNLFDLAEHDDRFILLSANSRVHSFNEDWLDVTPENAEGALAFLEQTHLIGALDLGQALAKATSYAKSAQNVHLVHVGSGLTAVGTKQEDLGKDFPENVHYIGLGVGKRWSRQSMKVWAEHTGGYYTQINPDESVSWRTFDLVATLNTPRLLDVQLNSDAVRDSRFLLHDLYIAQGEEICAVTRLGSVNAAGVSVLPKTVTVKGTLDGRPFEQQIEVTDVEPEADYLPRTWARLEIERLLAERNSNHRKAIVDLSKKMYVMSPYTSLLVLENEEMYEEFKVDRGRKDHWALYSAPNKIPIVYEPDPTMEVDVANAPKGLKPSQSQILKTILLRVAPRFMKSSRRSYGNERVVTAFRIYSGAYAMPVGGVEVYDFEREESELQTSTEAREQFGLNFRRLGELGDSVRFVNGNLPMAGGELFGSRATNGQWFLSREGRGEVTVVDRTVLIRDFVSNLDSLLAAPVRSGFEASRGFNNFSVPLRPAFGPANSRFERTDHSEFLVDERRESLSWGLSLDRDKSINHFFAEREFANGRANHLDFDGELLAADFSPLFGRQSGRQMADQEFALYERLPRAGDGVTSSSTPMGFGWRDSVRLGRLGQGIDASVFLLDRPYYSGDRRLFTDLLAYAPGMNTMWADVQGVLEQEAAPKLHDAPGSIEPEAAKLIAQARSTIGWQELVLGEKDGPQQTITFDGQGRYHYRRQTSRGLHEEVLCDCESLWHRYPELGVAAERSVTRYHRRRLLAMIPWMLPPAADLAHGVDLITVGERTVAFVPHGLDKIEVKDGKPIRYLRTHLVFAADGLLAERQLVEMPKGTVHMRILYDGKGEIRVFDSKDKEKAKTQLTVREAKAPNLKPDLKALVVLPLPYRNRSHVYPKFGLHPSSSLSAGINGCYRYLSEDKALQLLATAMAEQNQNEARLILRHCFVDNEKVKPGLFTILRAAGGITSTEPAFVELAAKETINPVIRYLAWLDNPLYHYFQKRLPLRFGKAVDKRDTFLQQLAVFHDLVERFERRPGNLTSAMVRYQDHKDVLAFVKSHPDSVLSWMLLKRIRRLNRYYRGRNDFLAQGWEALAKDKKSYLLRYEFACALYEADKYERAQNEFEALYTDRFDKGVLPALDRTFVNAFQYGSKDEWQTWILGIAKRMLDKKNRMGLIHLAWQAHKLNDRPLADNLFALALDGTTIKDKGVFLRLRAMQYLWNVSEHARADQIIRELLKDENLAKSPALWRWGSQIADQRSQTARAIGYLEEAMALEAENLPEVIQLEPWRNEHRRLLRHYRQLAQSLVTLKEQGLNERDYGVRSRELLQKTILVADRWRAHDPEMGAACRDAGDIARVLGQEDLAWDYLTSPSARPEEHSSLEGLASEMARKQHHDLAERAYETDSRAYPNNGLLWWSRLVNLQTSGRHEKARTILRKLAAADSGIEPNWVRDRARWQLEREASK